MLNETKKNSQLPYDLNVHDIHHYTILYVREAAHLRTAYLFVDHKRVKNEHRPKPMVPMDSLLVCLSICHSEAIFFVSFLGEKKKLKKKSKLRFSKSLPTYGPPLLIPRTSPK